MSALISTQNVDRTEPYKKIVMAGLVPAIHVLLAAKTWMPGTSPGMTRLVWSPDFRYRSTTPQREAPELCMNLSPRSEGVVHPQPRGSFSTRAFEPKTKLGDSI